MFQNLEATLINAAARFQAGDATAVDPIVNALRGVDAGNASLAPLIGSLLKLQDGDIKVFAACALARFGKGASGQVPELVDVLSARRPGSSSAAAHALGAIGTPEAIQPLISALQTHSRSELGYVASALNSAGTDAVPALRALQRAARRSDIGTHARHSIKDAIAGIQRASRQAHAQEMRDAGLYEYIPLTSADPDQTAYEHFAQYSAGSLAEEPGLVHEGRFRFIRGVGGVESELGLRIFRKADLDFVVVVSFDGGSYGLSPTNASEHVATAVSHIFGLDPDRTTWFERYTVTSGRPEERCTRVTYQADEEQGLLINPSWARLGNIVEVLREFGIEW